MGILARHSPELATHVGDNRYNDRLSDLSDKAIADNLEHQRQALKKFDALDVTGFPEEEKLNQAHSAVKDFTAETAENSAEFAEEGKQVELCTTRARIAREWDLRFQCRHVRSALGFLSVLGDLSRRTQRSKDFALDHYLITPRSELSINRISISTSSPRSGSDLSFSSACEVFIFEARRTL